MKIFTGFVTVLFFGLGLTNAYGLAMYVDMDRVINMNCTAHTGADENHPEWDASCEEGKTIISGVGLCSNTTAAAMAVRNPINSNTNKMFCYCKVIKPAVSQWIMVKKFSSASTCNRDCASQCANTFIGTDGTSDSDRTKLRQALFNAMGN